MSAKSNTKLIQTITKAAFNDKKDEGFIAFLDKTIELKDENRESLILETLTTSYVPLDENNDNDASNKNVYSSSVVNNKNLELTQVTIDDKVVKMNWNIASVLFSDYQKKYENGELDTSDFIDLPPLTTEELSEIKSLLVRAKTKSVCCYCPFSLKKLSDLLLKNATFEEFLTSAWSSQLNDKKYDQFFVAKFSPIKKGAVEAPTLTQIRPILKISPLFRLLEVRFVPGLIKWLKEKGSRFQNGAIRGSFTQVNTYVLTDLLKTRLFKYVVFFDVKNAYGSVNLNKLFAFLESSGALSKEYLQFLKAMYSRLQVSNGKSYFYPKRGVPQGATISAYLFSVYLNSLLDTLEAIFPSCRTLAYFDDVAVACSTLEQLDVVIAQTEAMLKDLGLEANYDKSAILELRLNQKPEITTFGNFKAVNSYKYLGTLLSFDLTIDEHVLYLAEQCSKQFKPFAFLKKNQNCISIQLGKVSQFFDSMINFALPAICNNDYNLVKLENSVSTLIKTILTDLVTFETKTLLFLFSIEIENLYKDRQYKALNICNRRLDRKDLIIEETKEKEKQQKKSKLIILLCRYQVFKNGECFCQNDKAEKVVRSDVHMKSHCTTIDPIDEKFILSNKNSIDVIINKISSNVTSFLDYEKKAFLEKQKKKEKCFLSRLKIITALK